MLKYFNLPTALFFVLTPLMAKTTFSLPVPTGAQNPKVQNPEINLPVCYLQTADGRILNLQRLCGQASPTITNPSSTTAPSSRISPSATVPIFRRGSGSGYASDTR